MRLPPASNFGSVDELVALHEPEFEKAVIQQLEDLHPEMVHLHHWFHLSNSLVQLIAARGIPVVVTLHDHYPICARTNMLRKGVEICAGPEAGWACADCLPPPGAAFLRESLLQRSLRRLASRVFNIRSLPAHLRRSSAEIFRARLNNLHNELCQASFIICPSAALKREMVAVWPDLEAHLTVLAHGLATSWGAKVNRTKAEKIRFAYVGNLMPHKGIDALLEAFRILDRPQAMLTLYGACPDVQYAQKIESKAKAYGVMLRGKYRQADLPGIYSEIDVAIVPSLCKESASLSTTEAFIGGAPVIASNLGALPEAVKDGENGLLFKAGDANDLAQKMRIFLDSPMTVQRFRQKLQQPKTIEYYAGEIADIYTQVMR
jgi:glycosyltransferase involved in cell wall biosynthesis